MELFLLLFQKWDCPPLKLAFETLEVDTQQMLTELTAGRLEQR